MFNPEHWFGPLNNSSRIWHQCLLDLRRSSVGCDVAQLIVCRLTLRQVRVRISARHPKGVYPTELTRDEEKKRTSANGSEWMFNLNVFNLNLASPPMRSGKIRYLRERFFSMALRVLEVGEELIFRKKTVLTQDICPSCRVPDPELLDKRIRLLWSEIWWYGSGFYLCDWIGYIRLNYGFYPETQ